jgi:hypothetical protein
MTNFLKMSRTLFLILALVACGEGTSSSDGSASSLYIETQKSQLNSDKSEMGIDFSVTNGYSDGVDINLKELAIKVTPCKIKQVVFSPSEVALSSSGEKQDVHAIVEFKNSCTPTSYILQGKTLLTLDGKSNELKFNSPLQEVIPEENQIITPSTTPVEEVPESDTNSSESNESSVDTINYAIKFSLEDEEVMKFNLEDKKSFKVALIDRNTGNYIADSQIDKITVTSKQPKLLKLFDADTNSVASEELTYNNKNYSTIYVQTYKYSGLADIDIRINYRNRKGNAETIQKTYSTMVLSGPPTAFSINSAGVSYNFETKWFENKFLISAFDRYNNIVNISPTIYVSAMTGFARDSSGKEVLYGNFGDVEGKLNVDKDSKIATFEANSTVFDNIDVNRDYLYVFGKVDDYEALGKWDIDSYESSHTDTKLTLSEAFNGENHTKLGFVLGHNYLVDPGSSESGEWQVKIDSTDGKYQLDAEGKAFVTLKFPTYLVGKRTALAVNFLGKTPETGKILRSGEVKFKTLRSFEGVHSPDPISIEEGTIGSVIVSRDFYINTGTGDKWRVLNSHVNCITKENNVRIVRIIENKLVSTIEEFIANRKSYGAYWSLELALKDTTKGGSLSFDECQVKNLPLF